MPRIVSEGTVANKKAQVFIFLDARFHITSLDTLKGCKRKTKKGKQLAQDLYFLFIWN